MSRRTATFHCSDHTHRADTCDPLLAAASAGELRLHALVRGSYPGRQMPSGVLPQIKSVGFWDASSDQKWGLGLHRNEGVEITFLENGRLGFMVDGRSYSLCPGHVTITRPWQPHGVGCPNVRASRLYWIILDLGVRQPHQRWRWPAWMVLSSDDIKQLTVLLRENEQPVWPGTPELGQCFVRMGQLIELSQTSPLPTSRLALLVNEVFVCLLELLRVQNPPRKVSLTSGERSVAMFLDHLRHELCEPWTLELMAERVGIARTRFAYHCRKLTNLSPMGYLQHLRLEKAKQMLVGERHSITMIALECGFSSSAYFSSVFRKHNQCSPRDYRDTAGDHPSKPLSRPSRNARIDPAR